MSLGVSWDLVPPPDRQRERTSERALFHGLRLVAPPVQDEPSEIRTELCACGGEISAGRDVSATDENIRAAVQTHNQSPSHQQWRRRRLAEAEREMHLTGEPVPEELLSRGRRCPCGRHAEQVGVR